MALVPFMFENNENDEEETYEVDVDSFDLEEYVTNYRGLTRIYRIMYIAKHCPKIRIKALQLATFYVLKTRNVELYQMLYFKQNSENMQSDYCNNDFNHDWKASVLKKGAKIHEQLDGKLKQYIISGVRDNIFDHFMYIGDHFVECGDFIKATICYEKAKAYVDKFTQLVSWHIKFIKLKIYLQDWSAVVSSIKNGFVLSDREVDSSLDISYCSMLACITGLIDLLNCNYKSAAQHFLKVNFYHYDTGCEVMVKNNVAVYCGLCALATFNRIELRNELIHNESFKPFLGLEPKIFDAILQLYNTKYDAYLKTLNDIKPLLLLDMYIGSHIKTLYATIRHKIIIEYLRPFDCADLRRMAICFDTSLPDLEKELVRLILDGHIKGSFDLVNKVLIINTCSDRSAEVFDKAMIVAKQINRCFHSKIMRKQVIQHQKNVRESEKLRMSFKRLNMG